MPNLLPSLGRRKLPMLDMPKLGGGAAGALGSIAYFPSDPGPKFAKCDGRFVSGLPQSFPYVQAPDYPTSFPGYGNPGQGTGITLLRFLNGKFVAVVATQIFTSSDGDNWVGATSRDGGNWKDITYGKGLYVAVCDNDPYFINTSPDGVVWTRRAISPLTAALYSVHFNGSMFVAVGADMLWSDDGITWNKGSWSGAANMTAVTFLKGTWYVYGGDGQYSYFSTDGKNWTRGPNIPVLSGYNVYSARTDAGRVHLCSRNRTQFFIGSGFDLKAVGYASLYEGTGIGCVVPYGPFIFVGDYRGYGAIYQDDAPISYFSMTGNSGAIFDAAYGADRASFGISDGTTRSTLFGSKGLIVPKSSSILRSDGERLEAYMRIAP